MSRDGRSPTGELQISNPEALSAAQLAYLRSLSRPIAGSTAAWAKERSDGTWRLNPAALYELRRVP